MKSSKQQMIEKVIGGGIILDAEATSLEPFAWYQRMRETNALSYDRENEMWQVFGYHDVLSVLNNPSIYSSEGRHRLKTAEERAKSTEPNILSLDPPRHHQMRSLITMAFTPRTIANLAPKIEEIVNQCLDRVAEDGSMDIIADLAQPLPVIVIAELIGVPREDRDIFKRWSDQAVSQDYQVSMQAHRDMALYFKQIADQRRKGPKDDLISALLDVQIEGQRLSEGEIVSFCDLLLVAGNETTTNLFGSLFMCLDEYPDVIEQLRENPNLIPGAIEEALRYRSPIQRLMRLVTEDTLLHGQQLHEGDLVNIWIGSANRDATVFPDPHLFDLQRSPNRHLGFGHGIHFCVGAPLTRLEVKIALNSILQRFRHIQRDRTWPLERMDAIPIFYGVPKLPITFTQI